MRAFRGWVPWSRALQQCFEGVLAASPASSAPSKLHLNWEPSASLASPLQSALTPYCMYVQKNYIILSEVEEGFFSVVFGFLKYPLNVCFTGAGFEWCHQRRSSACGFQHTTGTTAGDAHPESTCKKICTQGVNGSQVIDQNAEVFEQWHFRSADSAIQSRMCVDSRIKVALDWFILFYFFIFYLL